MLANPKRTKDEIVQWIREYFAVNGNDCCAVIGISGGKDSSVVAALCVEALGAERVIGVADAEWSAERYRRLQAAGRYAWHCKYYS